MWKTLIGCYLLFGPYPSAHLLYLHRWHENVSFLLCNRYKPTFLPFSCSEFNSRVLYGTTWKWREIFCLTTEQRSYTVRKVAFSDYFLHIFITSFLHILCLNKIECPWSALFEAVTLIYLPIPFEHKTFMLDFKMKMNWSKYLSKHNLRVTASIGEKSRFFGSKGNLLIPLWNYYCIIVMKI